MAEDNLDLCATCHGTQGEGRVLSVAKAEWTGLEDAPGGTIAAGTEVGCGICHGNPFTGGGEDD